MRKSEFVAKILFFEHPFFLHLRGVFLKLLILNKYKKFAICEKIAQNLIYSWQTYL